MAGYDDFMNQLQQRSNRFGQIPNLWQGGAGGMVPSGGALGGQLAGAPGFGGYDVPTGNITFMPSASGQPGHVGRPYETWTEEEKLANMRPEMGRPGYPSTYWDFFDQTSPVFSERNSQPMPLMFGPGQPNPMMQYWDMMGGGQFSPPPVPGKGGMMTTPYSSPSPQQTPNQVTPDAPGVGQILPTPPGWGDFLSPDQIDQFRNMFNDANITMGDELGQPLPQIAQAPAPQPATKPQPRQTAATQQAAPKRVATAPKQTWSQRYKARR